MTAGGHRDRSLPSVMAQLYKKPQTVFQRIIAEADGEDADDDDDVLEIRKYVAHKDPATEKGGSRAKKLSSRRLGEGGGSHRHDVI